MKQKMFKSSKWVQVAVLVAGLAVTTAIVYSSPPFTPATSRTNGCLPSTDSGTATGSSSSCKHCLRMRLSSCGSVTRSRVTRLRTSVSRYCVEETPTSEDSRSVSNSS